MPASEGPAPPFRPSRAGSSTWTPKRWSSITSLPSAGSRPGLPPAVADIEVLEVLPEDPLFQLLAHPGAVDLPELAVEVAPGLVGGEQHPVTAHPPALDLGQQPAGPEADRPGDVGVHPVALLDPVQEAGHQPDVAADPAAEVDQVHLHPLPVLLDQGDVVADVRGPPGAGVEVEDQVVLLGRPEAG